MTTLIRPPFEAELPRSEPREEETTFVCANPDHYLLAARREQVRLHDRRFGAPDGRIPQHDYCGAQEEREAIWFKGRPAFCPLGVGADDHEWQESARGLGTSRRGPSAA